MPLPRVIVAVCVLLSGVAAAQSPLLLICNQHDATLGFIDPVAGKQVFALPEGEYTAHEVAVSPDGRTAYVPIYGSGGVSRAGTDGAVMLVVDVPSRKITGKVEFGHGVRAHLPVYDRKRNLLYVSTELDQSLTIVDPKALKVVGSIPTGQKQSHMFALSHDGRFAYTANFGSGTVSVLDLEKRTLANTIPAAERVQRISVSNDDKLVFVGDDATANLVVIDTATRKVKTRIALPSQPYGTASTPDGRWLLVTMHTLAKLAVIDLRTLQVARVLDLPASTGEVLIPNGNMAYASSDTGNAVYAIDLHTWKLVKTIPAGQFSDGMAWVPALANTL